MAKDFTLRGGRRTNQTGRPKKALKEKLDNGNPGHRKLKVLDAPEKKGFFHRIKSDSDERK